LTISAPPRPPRRGDPVDRDELDALVNALIEEARRRARRRRLVYAAIATSVALTGVAVFAVFDHAAQSQSASPAPTARHGLAAAAAVPKIAFLSDVPKARLPKGVRWQGELYVVNVDGSGMRRLARFASAFTLPTWSPDGRMIAFDRRVGPIGAPPPGNGACRVCHGEIFAVNADGSGLRNLTGNAGGGVPAWSPDGEQIAFSRDNGFTPNLYVMNADGSGRRRVTQEPIHVWGASWSPDGQRLTFASGVPGNPGEFDIYVVNVAGSGQQKLTQAPNLEYAPAWSPDGRTIAYLRTRGTSNRKLGDLAAEIYLMNADGSGQRRLVPVSISDSSFSWSPDGRTIAFVSKRDGNDEVYVVNVDGSGLRNLTRSSTRDGHPVWSSDGRTIGFVSNRGGNRDIYVMNADGSGLRNLTRNLDQKAFGIAWMPTPRS
jgi:Tol biopolymer transport system component